MTATPPYLVASLSMCPPSVGVFAMIDRIRSAMCSGRATAAIVLEGGSGRILAAMDLLVTVGLDAGLVEQLRGALEARLVAYPAVPRIYSLEGRVFVESATVTGRWLEPRGVVYYGYFDDAAEVRRALALGTTPTFPDLRATLVLDERAMALLLALRADEARSRRGFVSPGIEVRLEREHVLKWGNRHCGDDKARAVGSIIIRNASVVEPFVEGSSERILLVGDHAWHLRYESTDWRKNVGATVTRIEPDEELVDRARRTSQRLGLAVAGVDYVVGTKGATLLEVNAYPGFDDVSDAEVAFVDLAKSWWERLGDGTSPLTNDWSALHKEFDAADGSFLLQVRTALEWDVVAFRRLTREMLAYVRSREPGRDIPQWAADGFWYVSSFVESWTQHPNFPRPLPAEYYRDAYERLHNLAFWLFQGTSPYEDNSAFERPLQAEPTT
jgi:hypothetical protein